MVSPMLGDVMARSMIETFSDNLLINIPSSLITTKLNLFIHILHPYAA